MALPGQLAGDLNPSYQHGHTSGGRFSPTYITWVAMMGRCRNPNHVKYPKYGGAGIEVCARWLDFDGFLADMGERPEGKTIDRLERTGNYELLNCRWATPLEQTHNRVAFVNSSSLKTHCPQGHPYEGNNLHVTPKGYRKCRTCDRLRAQANRDRLKQSEPLRTWGR
jgi:hypothetical protein